MEARKLRDRVPIILTVLGLPAHFKHYIRESSSSFSRPHQRCKNSSNLNRRCDSIAFVSRTHFKPAEEVQRY